MQEVKTFNDYYELKLDTCDPDHVEQSGIVIDRLLGLLEDTDLSMLLFLKDFTNSGLFPDMYSLDGMLLEKKMTF